MDVPDTIFLGLNFKQLLYLGGALGLLISLFLFAGLGIAIVLGAPVAVLAGFLSFFTHNNQSFSVILQSLIRFLTQKKMYIWRRSDDTTAEVKTSPHPQQVGGTPPSSGGDSEKIREASTGLVFADGGGASYDDLDVAL